ncbi:MAG: Hsp20/alpha crystallin family protein, partial [Erysipelotrichaceae bacterium]|nr:Hsp20/alpha crystallin family protein [Erysipelotrichaceae bacterium]
MLMPSIFRDNLFDDWMDDFSWMRDFGNVDRKLYG